MPTDRGCPGKEPHRSVADRVREFALPVVRECGLSLWDVEFEKIGGQWELTVYIERFGPGGEEIPVTIDDCEAVSRALDPLLDRYDPVDDAYTFHVSSAGLERTLKKEEHFRRYLGFPVEVRLYRVSEGAKVHEGKLASYQNGRVGLSLADGRALSFGPEEIALVRTKYEW